ncbi:MAG: hypothetical protein EA366_06360 [Spirulina sp. DLM2.Bin59]|nr:MAG: hypothetical protein EA366_06360 [Spirulina sp. DLM2.Bin59]
MLSLNATPNFLHLRTVGDRLWGEICPWDIFALILGVKGMLPPDHAKPGKLPILILSSRSGDRLPLRTAPA